MIDKSEASESKKQDSDKLSLPIPNLSVARSNKEGYREWPIDSSNPLFDEDLVNISTLGLAGQSYYSRPNTATGKGLADVPKELYLRKTLAEKLAHINSRLNNPAMFNLFGGPVELYVEDGYRPNSLQKKLHESVFPNLIRQQNPNITDEQVDEKLEGLIAVPSDDPAHPSPHATGGAVDVMLRYRQGTPDYVAGSEIFLGYEEGDTGKRTYPDYFELIKPLTGDDRLARINRRAFYAVMTGRAFGFDSGLQVNPTEWWHWSYGDQMWAKLQGHPAAIYGPAIPKA